MPHQDTVRQGLGDTTDGVAIRVLTLPCGRAWATECIDSTVRQGLGDTTDHPVSHGRSTRPIASAAAAAAAKLQGRREMLVQVTARR